VIDGFPGILAAEKDRLQMKLIREIECAVDAVLAVGFEHDRHLALKNAVQLGE